MKHWKKALRFALCLVPVALIGGWFAAKSQLPSLDPSLVESAVRQAGSLEVALAVTAVSSAVYTFVCGFFGYMLAEKVGLLRPFRFQKAALIRVLSVSVLGGAVLSLDAWTFAAWIPPLKASYEAAGSFNAAVWIASILYGGVTEEIMLRFFLMSGLAFLGWKLFFRQEAQAPAKVLKVLPTPFSSA